MALDPSSLGSLSVFKFEFAMPSFNGTPAKVAEHRLSTDTEFERIVFMVGTRRLALGDV